MKSAISLFVILLFVVGGAYAQNEKASESYHEHHRNEIGIANAPVYFINEAEWAYGLHVHYITRIEGSRFGIGFGYERIFDAHKHNTFGVVGSYRPTDRFSFNVSPGFTFEDKESSKIDVALHLETTYEFELKNFHVGPSFEIAFDPEDIHLSLGVHIGVGF